MMQARLIYGVLLGAGLVSSAAVAGQSFDPNLVPALHAGLSFGGPTHRGPQFELALQMTYRGLFTQPIEPPRDRPIQFTPLSLDLMRLSGTRSGLASAFVLSHDLMADDQALHETDWRSDGVPRWVWWVAGGVAVTAAALAASGGERDEERTTTGNPPDPECTGGIGCVNDECAIPCDSL
jgi:hypothetical protein